MGFGLTHIVYRVFKKARYFSCQGFFLGLVSSHAQIGLILGCNSNFFNKHPQHFNMGDFPRGTSTRRKREREINEEDS